MTVSVTEAKTRLSQLLTAVERGERVTIERHGQVIAEIVKPTAKRAPRFGTLKGVVRMTPEQFQEATRPMTDEEVDSFLEDSVRRTWIGAFCSARISPKNA